MRVAAWDGNDLLAYQAAAAAFTEREPNVKVEIELPQGGGDHYAKIKTLLAADSEQDVMYMATHAGYMEVFALGAFLDLTGLIKQDRGFDSKAALYPQAVASVLGLWQTLGLHAEGHAYLRTLLALPAERLPPAARAKALLQHGIVTRKQGDYPAARALEEESLALYQTLGDQRGTATCLTHLGLVACYQEEYAAGRRHLEAALTLSERLGDRSWMGHVLVRLGQVAHAQGDQATAQVRYEAGLGAAREAGQTVTQAWASYHLGRLALDRGDAGSARRWLVEALRPPLVLGGGVGQAHLLAACAALAAAERRPTRALRLAGAAAAALAAFGAILPPDERRGFEPWLAMARAALDAAGAAGAWAAGQSMTPDHAVAYALEDPPDER